MRENVIISYRGANYELGQWPYGYGIWSAAAPQSEPLEGWPATPEGWSAAWYRFAAMEAPGTIQPVTHVAVPADPYFAPQGSQAASGQPAANQPPDNQVVFGRPAGGQIPYGQAPYGQIPYGQAPYGQAAATTTAFGRPAAAPAVVSERQSRLAAALLGVGVAVGVISLFPGYLGGPSLAAQASSLVPHVIYLAAWLLSAALILRRGSSLRAGALLGVGTSAVTLGLFFADAGTVISGGAHLAGAGLWLAVAGWLACAAGSALAFGRWPADWPRRIPGREAAVVVTLLVAALGAAIAFAPPWDRYTLSTAAGFSQSLTAGNAFANPAPVIVGDVAVMVALFAVVIVAALWRPARLGWALAAGAAVPMVAQAISAIVQINEPPSPSQFGISPSVAAQAGLKITAGLTGVFWIYCAFLVVLLIACAWLAAGGDEIEGVRAGGTQPGPAAAAAPGGPAMTGEGPGAAHGSLVPGPVTSLGHASPDPAPTDATTS